jgi:peroxiredoxin
MLFEELNMSLQDQLDAFRAEIESGRPPYNATRAAIDTMHRATAELKASGQEARALKVGDKAPSFTLNDADGKPVSSVELLGSGPLIVTFYRGAWCPYCNMDLKAMEAMLPTYRANGASLVAISPQTAPNSRKAIRNNGLTFPILSDPGNETAHKFGLRFALPDYLIELYKAMKNDLPGFNGDPSWTLPMPARYVIGSDGLIAYAEVNADYTQRPDPEDLLPALQQLSS